MTEMNRLYKSRGSNNLDSSQAMLMGEADIRIIQ
jgi:hypothetical protein